MSKLVVVRGNSGSGKTTIAQELLNMMPDAILVEQDYFIKYAADSKTPAQESARRTKIFTAVKSALLSHEIVILEGVFDSRRYKEYFSDLIECHPTDNHFYYIDLSFEETLRRHETRDKRHEFGEEKMSGWYIAHDQLGYEFEESFDSNIQIDEAVKRITNSVMA
jgi:deoxyadenosine/deoxycytidine kinase